MMVRAALLAVVAVAAMAAVSASSRVEKEAWTVLPTRWTRGERVPSENAIEMIVAVKQSNTDLLEETLMAVSDPDSPLYGKHLTRDQVDAMVAPRPDDILAVLAWLQDGGVDLSKVEATGNSDMLEFTTTIGVAEKLLGAAYYTFTHKTHTKFTVNRLGNGAYSLPSHIAEAVDFVSPSVRFPAIQTMKVSPASPDLGVTPTFLRSLYKVGNATGKASNNKQAVAQFLGQFYSPSDLSSFFSQFAKSESGQTPTVIGPNDSSNPGIEASLDIEYIMSVATNIATDFWSTAGQQPDNPSNEPFLKFLTNVAKLSDADAPNTISTSYGDDEPGVNFEYASRVNQEFQKFGLRGISLMFASGDGGVAGGQPGQCTTFVPTFPAGSPYVTAVGGTQGYNPETAASLSAGGFSNYWARPSYQVEPVKHYFSVASNLPASNLYNHTGAGIPDVAAQAENFNIVYGGFTTFVAGTSCASPTFAAIVSLLNDLRLQAGKSALGYLNPLFYKNPSMFTDITSGSNPGCGTNGFSAAQGWDPVTGLGTANYNKMATVVQNLQ